MSVILVLDSDPRFCQFMESDFNSAHCVFSSQTWDEALELLNDVRFECILFNPDFSRGDIKEQLAHIRTCQPYSQLILFSEKTIYELDALNETFQCDGSIVKTKDKTKLNEGLEPFLAAAVPLPSQPQTGPLNTILEQTEKFSRTDLDTAPDNPDDTPSRTRLKFNDSSPFNSIL
ncbi:MAG: hypothetical protein P1V97_38775 [Planctomycetota bacterium]|nr:hypothetical protein [Planctomycetota bacterium]